MLCQFFCNTKENLQKPHLFISNSIKTDKYVQKSQNTLIFQNVFVEFTEENRLPYSENDFFLVIFGQKNLVNPKKCRIFAVSNLRDSGCSAARLAHLLWEQGVPGSNPGIPTGLETDHWLSVVCFLLNTDILLLVRFCYF